MHVERETCVCVQTWGCKECWGNGITARKRSCGKHKEVGCQAAPHPFLGKLPSQFPNTEWIRGTDTQLVWTHVTTGPCRAAIAPRRSLGDMLASTPISQLPTTTS